MIDPSTLLSQLRDPSLDGPLDRLLDLMVDDLLDRSLGEVVDPWQWADIGADVLRGWLASNRGERRLLQAWSDLVDWLSEQDGTIGELLPPEARSAAERFCALPCSPDAGDVLRTLDRPPVRKLIRHLLHDTLLDYGRKVAAPMASSPLSKGIANRLGGAGRGFGERLRQRTGVLGAFAEEAIGAVSGEVERQLDKRADEFAESASGTVLRELVAALTDPERSDEQVRLRLALLEGLLQWSGPDLAREFGSVDERSVARIARDLAESWTTRDDLEEQVAGWLEALLDSQGHLRLAEALDEIDLLDAFRTHARTLLRHRAAAFVNTDAFAAWLRGLPDLPEDSP